MDRDYGRRTPLELMKGRGLRPKALGVALGLEAEHAPGSRRVVGLPSVARRAEEDVVVDAFRFDGAVRPGRQVAMVEPTHVAACVIAEPVVAR